MPVIIAVITSVASIFMAGKHYLDSEFVNTSDFDRFRLNIGIAVLEDRKQILEHRIYVYELCKLAPACASKKSLDGDIAKDLRDLKDVRSQLEILKKKLFE